MDIWSLVTGLASIASFMFSIPAQFSNWRKYTIPISYTSLSFVIGRISLVFSQATNQLFNDPYLLFILIVLLLIVVVGGYFFIQMIHVDVRYSYTILVFLMVFFIPQTVRLYPEIAPIIPAGDYLKLAQIKEQSGEFSIAIRYFQVYQNKVDNDEIKSQIDQEICELQYKQLDPTFRRLVKKGDNIFDKGHQKTEESIAVPWLS